MTDEKKIMQSLEPAAIEHLDVLLNEITDMHVALKYLAANDESDMCVAAVEVLHHQMDARLAKAMNIVATGDGEG